MTKFTVVSEMHLINENIPQYDNYTQTWKSPDNKLFKK